jgi:cytochrome c oxidase subunit 4
MDTTANQNANQQHPISIYLKVWALLFVLSALSYMVDYFQFQGYTRWTLVLIFMFLKAGFIVSIFMHLGWERYALKCTLLLPPLAIGVLIWLMSVEADYTLSSRQMFLGQ